MEAQRLDEAVDDPLSNHANFDNDADYDADASRVQAVVNANPLALEEGEEEEMAVPTEYLQEDLGMKIELSDRFRPGRLSRFIAHKPAKMISTIAAVAAILTVWVLIGATDTFSVEETLFRPTDDVDVKRFVQMSHTLPFSARSMLGGRRSLFKEDSVTGDRASVTLVFEKRGDRARDVLGLRELKAIHDIESELRAWASASDAKPCYQAADGSCVPLDSLNSWLYPTVHHAGEAQAELRFDGGMAGGGAAWSCAPPPFGAADVAQTARWLHSSGRDGVFAREHAETTSAEAAHSPYLRATLYLDTDQMDAGRWYELARLLWRRSSSWLSQSAFVKVWYGGPTDLTLAELLVALTNDMWLLGVALLAVLAYMRLFFGVWRLALLAALQILISLPLMYWLVTVLFGQAKLSAFAGASLWVVVGVSADNIFVLTETWGQSRQLLRDGRPAEMPDRLSWTVRQAGVPLFYANATTAVSLFINCFSSLPAIFQFGLCGGILLFVNMALGLSYLPALLVLQERGAFDRSTSGGQAARDEELRKRMLALQAIHRSLWRQRARVLTWFGVAVLLLLPTAVSLSPGADASFTFSPDPAMARVVNLARTPPAEGGLFRALDGVNGTNFGTVVLTNASAAAAGVPERYRQLLAGSYVPPPPPRDATFFAVVLSALMLYDAALLALLARAIAADAPVHFLQPPPGGRRYQALLCLAAALGLAVLALCTFCLTLLLCDFAVAHYLLLGNALGLLLLAHAALCAKLSRIAHDGGEWGVLRASPWMADERSAPQLLLGAAALLALLGVLVLVATDSAPPAPRAGWGWPAFGWSYGPSGLALLLSLLLLWDGAVGLRAAQFAFDGYAPDDAPLRALPEQRLALLACGGALVLGGWVLLLLSGLPVADGFSTLALSNAVGAVCAGNALGHAVLGACYRRGRPTLLFKPTQWALAHRTEALGLQGLLAAAWTCAAIVSFSSGALAGPCDYDHDHATSLGELGRCFAGFMKSMGVEGAPLPSAGMVALGLALALLWLLDALLAHAGCRVLRSGEPIACLAPLPRSQPGSREAARALYARLRLARALLGALALALLGLALAPAAFAAVFGPRALGAYNLLALTLLAHVPPLSALLRVLLTHERHHMLAPTAWSERSRVPALLTLLADLFCLVAGITILVTQDRFALPPLATSDWHGLLLAVLLTLDSHLLLAAARAQFEHTPEQPAAHVLLFIRPLPGATAAELDELGDALADAGGCCAAAGAGVAWLSLFPAAAAALFSSVRVLSVAMELLLCVHALLAFLLAHLVHADSGAGILAPPPQLDDERGTAWMRRLFGGGVAPLGLAFLLPLVDGGLVFEAVGNLVFSALVAGGALTHGLYSGALEMPFDLQPPAPRRALLGTCAAGVLCGGCYALAISPPHSVPLASTGFFLPVPYMLVTVACFFAMINIPPLAMITEVWYTGRTVCGFDAEDAPRDRRGQTVGAGRLLLATLATCVAFGAMWATANLVVTLDDRVQAGPSGRLAETPKYANVERCRLYWGLDLAPYEGGTQVARLRSDRGGFHPEDPAAQEELLRACDAMHASPLSPLHSQAAAHRADHPCVMRELHDYVVGTAGAPAAAWPIPADQFAPKMADFLRHSNKGRRLQDSVGFADPSLSKVTWLMQRELPAQFAAADSMELLANPGLLAAYRASWDAYLASLPAYVRAHPAAPAAAAAATGASSSSAAAVGNGTDGSTPASPPPPPPPSVELPAAERSALRFGAHVCSKWSVLAVERAFFASVQRALTFTPLFSMGAIALFSRSLVIAYAALYSLLGMLLVLLGTMHVLGVPLGITAALALALVLGMSVDYIIHLAHAYKNSIFADRYHKSRAAVFARGQSIASAAATTLGAVLPLLWAQLLPLRQFGTVFALVTLISLAFAFFFLGILMVIGPLRTRAGARAPRPAPAQGPYAETERVGMVSGELTTLHRPAHANHKYPHDEAGAQVDPNPPGRSRQAEDDEDEEML